MFSMQYKIKNILMQYMFSISLFHQITVNCLIFDDCVKVSKVKRFNVFSAPSSGFLPRFLSAFRRQPALLSSSYRNWYAYRYDGNEREIGDGGNDMFDGGNIVSIFCTCSDTSRLA